jgi:hypothetical protein
MRSAGKTVVSRAGAGAPAIDARGNAGEYQLLCKYLRDRFANRIVLTFGDIEDLLGFSLPEAARLQREWWDGTDTTACGAWMRAGRTATVNLPAQTVLFERHAT